MPIFSFDARDEKGGGVRGVETAIDIGQLDHMLSERGLVLVRAKRGDSPASLGGRAKRSRILIDFCYHLATAVDAGVPLVASLQDLQEDGASPVANILDDMTRKVEAGSQLSEAMESYPALFSPLVRSLVSAAEETGDMPRILRDLVAYLEWTDELHRKIKSALSYPTIVLIGLFALCVLLTTVVLPNFLEIFADLKVELPFVTRALIAFQHFAESYGLHTLGVLIGIGVALRFALRTEKGLYRFHKLLLQLPILGRVILMLEMSRFSHNLGLLYGSGIPIIRALEMVSQIVQNRVVREVISESVDGVREGKTLTDALRTHGFMPPMVMRMISLGETSGRLDHSLEHVAGYYDREVPGIIDSALAIFNTLVVVILGIVLGSVALGIFVPLYQMMGNLNE